MFEHYYAGPRLCLLRWGFPNNPKSPNLLRYTTLSNWYLNRIGADVFLQDTAPCPHEVSSTFRTIHEPVHQHRPHNHAVSSDPDNTKHHEYRKCFMFLFKLKDSTTIFVEFTHILIGDTRYLPDSSLMSPGTVQWNYTLTDFQMLPPSSKTSLGRDSWISTVSILTVMIDRTRLKMYALPAYSFGSLTIPDSLSFEI